MLFIWFFSHSRRLIFMSRRVNLVGNLRHLLALVFNYWDYRRQKRSISVFLRLRSAGGVDPVSTCWHLAITSIQGVRIRFRQHTDTTHAGWKEPWMAVKRSNLPPAEVRRSFCAEGYKNTHGAHPVEKQPKEFLTGQETIRQRAPSSQALGSCVPKALCS